MAKKSILLDVSPFPFSKEYISKAKKAKDKQTGNRFKSKTRVTNTGHLGLFRLWWDYKK
jgi:hypothetical protein